jgi:hypothetical protein
MSCGFEEVVDFFFLEEVADLADGRRGRPPAGRVRGEMGGKYPSIAPAWRRSWAEVTPLYAFSVLRLLSGDPEDHPHDQRPWSR